MAVGSFRDTIRVSISLDPGQACCFIGPGSGSKLFADDINRLKLSLFQKKNCLVYPYIMT